MEYVTLGSSNLNISKITFGCMSLEPDQHAANQVINHALDSGINFFDTADLYQAGKNEEILGKALITKRQNVYIATKVGNQLRADGNGWDWNPTKNYLLKAVDNSLRRLKTDYIDLYQLHGGTIDDPTDETIEAFEILIEKGKIRNYGISSIRPNVIRRFLDSSSICSVMMQHSLLDRRPEEVCLDLLESKNVGVLARGTLAQGILTGKEKSEYLGYNQEEINTLRNAVKELVYKYDVSPIAITSMFTLQKNGITSIVAGARTIPQLDDFVNIFDNQLLLKEDVSQLSFLVKPNKYENHR